MSVLLRFGKGSHSNIMLLQPSGDGIGVTPLIFSVAINFGNFHCTELFLDIFLLQPVFVLIERLGSKRLAHYFIHRKRNSSTLYPLVLHILIAQV